MHKVGKLLSDAAHNGFRGQSPGEPLAEQLARSALNRYYYGCYLKVRELLGTINPDWSRTPHKNIPALLTGAVTERVKSQKKRLRSQEQHIDVSAKSLESKLYNLAHLMETSYAHRIVADYEPEQTYEYDPVTKVIFLPGRQTKLHDAQRWQQDVDTLFKDIRHGISSIGL